MSRENSENVIRSPGFPPPGDGRTKPSLVPLVRASSLYLHAWFPARYRSPTTAFRQSIISNCIDRWRWATYPARPHADMSPARRTVPLSGPCSWLRSASATRTPGTTSWQRAVIRSLNAQRPPPFLLPPTYPHPSKFRQYPSAWRVWKRSRWKGESLEGPRFRF